MGYGERSDISTIKSLEERERILMDTKFGMILVNNYPKLMKIVKTQNSRKLANPKLIK